MHITWLVVGLDYNYIFTKRKVAHFMVMKTIFLEKKRPPNLYSSFKSYICSYLIAYICMCFVPTLTCVCTSCSHVLNLYSSLSIGVGFSFNISVLISIYIYIIKHMWHGEYHFTECFGTDICSYQHVLFDIKMGDYVIQECYCVYLYLYSVTWSILISPYVIAT